MRILGLDLGTRRIGLALSDPEHNLALPAGVLERRDPAQDLTALAELIEQREVERAVVGLPLHMNGRAGPEARAAREFAQTLAERTGIPVDTQDERWTSQEAERALRDSGASRKRRRMKGAVDELAAALILRSYLERRQAEARHRQGEDRPS